MGQYAGQKNWPEDIYLFEQNDPVEGGPDGIDNLPIKQLTDRTEFLRQEIIRVSGLIPGTEEYQVLVDELRGLDVTQLEQRLRHTEKYIKVSNTYAKDKLFAELFTSRNTLASLHDVGVVLTVAGSDCVDLETTEGIVVGREYMIVDSETNHRRVVTVTEVLVENRIRIAGTLNRTYSQGSRLIRTSWELPNIGSENELAVARAGDIYWSVPIFMSSVGVEQHIFVTSDSGATLQLYWKDIETEWALLEQETSFAVTGEPGMMTYRYLLPATINTALELKVVCTAGIVRVGHIVVRLSMTSSDPDAGTVLWGNINGTLNEQADLQNALTVLGNGQSNLQEKMPFRMVKLTQVEYDALEVKDPLTFYIVDGAQMYLGDELIGGGSAFPIGFEYPWPSTVKPFDGSIPLNGGEHGRDTYPELWAFAQEAGLVIDESQWQAQAAAQSSVGYYSDGDGLTTFRVPKIVDFVRGLQAGREVGDFQEDAIRDMAGYVGHGRGFDCLSNLSSSSPFVGSTTTTGADGSGSTASTIRRIDFNPSRVVPTADENRPKNIARAWYVQAAHGTINAGVVDVAGLMNDVARNAGEINDLRLAAPGAGMPSGRYIDLTLGASGSKYTAPADGWIGFRKTTNAASQGIGIDNLSINPGGGAADVSFGMYVTAQASTGLRVFVPVRKGDTVVYDYNAGGATAYFRFIFAEGAEQ